MGCLFQRGRVGGVMKYVWLIVLVFVLAGCGGDEEAPTPTPTKTPVSVEVVSQPTDTPTAVQTSVEVPTNTPAPVIAPTNTSAPAPTDTPAPLPTATPTPDLPRVTSEANLRSGPGTNYDVVGQAGAGQALDLVGRSAAGDWYQLANGAWIAAFLVEGSVGEIDVVAAPPLPTLAPVQPVQVVVPTATSAPAPAPVQSAVCECGYDAYKCADFGGHLAAQACFNYCVAIGKGDIHRLDRDGDGSVCED